MSNTEETARPGSWDEIRQLGRHNSYTADCILELRARVERLEQAQQQPAPSTPAGQGELVRLVAELIAHFASTSRVGDDCTPAARRLIIAVVIWLESQAWRGAADALRREVGR